MLKDWVFLNLLRVTGKPYTERKENNIYIRTFYSWVNPYSLKWHIDPEDRLVIPTHHNDWYVQLDDELPVSLNKAIFIKKGQWHRLIKGTGSLTIKVKKYG